MPTQQDVTFVAADGHAMRASLALPDDTSRPRPGVLVIHEIFGLNDDMRRITRRFADSGYVALAPDLFDRPGPRILCVARAVAAMRRKDGTAFRDLEHARRHLADIPECDGDRLGVVGFCMGGGFALLLALRADFRAVAPYYGDVPKTAEELEGICPVVGGFGGRDRIFAPRGRRLQRLLTELDVRHDVVVYEHAGHSYMSQHEPSALNGFHAIGPMKVGYDDRAAEDSWRRMLAFFEEEIGG